MRAFCIIYHSNCLTKQQIFDFIINKSIVLLCRGCVSSHEVSFRLCYEIQRITVQKHFPGEGTDALRGSKSPNVIYFSTFEAKLTSAVFQVPFTPARGRCNACPSAFHMAAAFCNGGRHSTLAWNKGEAFWRACVLEAPRIERAFLKNYSWNKVHMVALSQTRVSDSFFCVLIKSTRIGLEIWRSSAPVCCS